MGGSWGLGVALVLSATASASAANREDVCARAAPALAGQVCVATPHGAAFAPDRQRAVQLAAFATTGEQRFETHFGRPATPYVVYEVVDQPQARAANTALRDLGFNRVLGWMSRAAQQELQTRGIREGVVERMKADGKPQSMIDQVVERRLSRLDADIAAREASVLPHELVHQLYVEAGWPGVPGDRSGHYAGPGPDWMDELSAILAETEESANARRALFKDLYSNSKPELYGTLAQADLLDLSVLLDQVHPVHARDQAAAQPVKRTEGVAMNVQVMARGAIAPTILFYVKDRMVADFLIAQSGDPAIFGSILDGFRRGQTFDAWLATEGRARGLAPDRAGLDRQWRGWLRSTLGEPRLTGA
jgi:hypothetical protein